MFTFTPIVLAVLVSAVVNLFVTVVSWQRKTTLYGLYFALGMTGVTFWTILSALGYAVVPLEWKIFFATLEGWAYMSAHPFFAMFALSFAGYSWLLKKNWVKAFFIFLPVTNILWVTTNHWHGLVWQEFIRKADNIVVFVHGPAYGWIFISSNLLTLIIIASLIMASFKGSAFSRQQGRILLVSILLTYGANIAYNLRLGIAGVDWTSVFFSATGALFVWALYGQKFLDVIPIAREKLIESLSDGMIVLDVKGRIIDLNQPAAQMLDSTPETLMGKNVDEIPVLAQSISKSIPEQEIRTEIKAGSAEKRYFDVLITPLFEKETQIVGKLIIFRDMTVRKRNELRLLQFNRAVEQSPTSVLITDPDGNIIYVNPQFSLLTGYTFEEIAGKNPRILQSGQTAPEVYEGMWRAITAGQIWKGEFLNKKKNGELYWEHVTMAPVLDHDGRTLNFIAIKADITERKRAEEELRISEEKFAKAFRLSADVISITSVDDGITMDVNNTIEKVFGYARAEIIGKSVMSMKIWVEPTRREQFVASLVRDGFAYDWEVQMRTKSGEIIDILLSGELIELQGKKYILGTLRDITGSKQLEAKLERLATTDPLTGVLNRREMLRRAELELERARRYAHPISIIMLDVDRFKKVNDTYGHAAGDRVLISLVDLLTEELRASDLISRYGGEEFMLLLPETSLERAEVIAERIREIAANTPVLVDGQSIHFTISLGVTSSKNIEQEFEILLKEADRLLYQAKQTGRNRVEVSSLGKNA